MDKTNDLIVLANEKIRQEKQLEQNASSFVNAYFGRKSYSTQRAIKEAYLKIVRDKILF